MKEVARSKYANDLVTQLIGNGATAQRTPLSRITSLDTNTHVLRPIGVKTVMKPDSPAFGQSYRVRQKCAVCLRRFGRHVLTPYKCLGCSRHGKDFYVCADREYTMHGKSEVRECFSWHMCNTLPPKRRRCPVAE